MLVHIRCAGVEKRNTQTHVDIVFDAVNGFSLSFETSWFWCRCQCLAAYVFLFLFYFSNHLFRYLWPFFFLSSLSSPSSSSFLYAPFYRKLAHFSAVCLLSKSVFRLFRLVFDATQTNEWRNNTHTHTIFLIAHSKGSKR